MDFGFTEEQDALRDLAAKIFNDHATVDAIRKVEAATEAGGAWCLEAAWKALAESSLLGIALSEDVGGSGLGLIELCVLLEEQGKRVVPLPLWSTLFASLVIDAHGSEEQRKELLPSLADGSRFATIATHEPDLHDPMKPDTSARAEGDGARLTGVKSCVPAAAGASCIVAPARGEDGSVGLYLVDPTAEGVSLERQLLTTGEVVYRVEFTDAPARALGSAGAEALEWIVDRIRVGLAAMELGVCQEALAMTARYTTDRKQFDRRIASFQAVQQRAADAFIDVEAIRLTTWRAAWWLTEGRPGADVVAIAKFWASEGGHRVVYAAQHLHGGMGVDTDYSLFRYYLWSKQIELTLGGTQQSLERLGNEIAQRESA